MYAEVAVRRGIDRVRGSGGARGGGAQRDRGVGGGVGGGVDEGGLTYAVPEGMSVRVGELVTVPLGSTSTTGVVLRVGGAELLGGLDPGRVRAVVAGHGSVLPASVLELARWVSRYYVCPLGMVMPAVVPGAVQRGVGRRVRRVVELGAQAGEIAGRGAGLTARSRGALARALELAAETWPMEPGVLADRLGVGAGVISGLVRAGALVEGSRREVRAGARPALAAAKTAEGSPRPTAEQAAAIAGVVSTLGGYAAHLVFGVTGSGKTEVYLRAIEAMLARDAGAGAIVLVPEIALTPQTERRFVERFGAGTVAVLHSGLTASQRHAYWAACAGGEGGGPRVVVGARSAVFAPLGRVGLIVVDEEHDGSYKQDQLPRYHARDVAIKRAQLEGCPVVLGSATPSLESWWNAGAGGTGGAGGAGGAGVGEGGGVARYRLHRLRARATGAQLPTVRVVDLLEEARLRTGGERGGGGWRDGHLHLIGPTLEHELDRVLGDGGQAIVLLNRRGYANYICCATSPRCAWVMRCEHCDVTAVYHTEWAERGRGGHGGVVRCHHCLGETLLPSRCPVCAAGVNTFGMGTQRVEAELARKLGHRRGLEPGVSMVRADADSMRGGARAYFDVLGRFGRGEVRVLLGTQMIAKGLDFANVRLVGVVQADTALALPDFRASERTFQLVAQVAGRAGRAGGVAGRGLVIVQTLRPDEPAIVLAGRHDYESFAAGELAVRRLSGLPPAWRMARVVCRDTDPAKAVARAQGVRGALDAAAGALGLGAEVLRLRGPHPCAIARIDDHHRQEVIVQAGGAGEAGGSRRGAGVIQRLLGHARRRGLLVSDAHTAVDVDPVTVL